MLRLFRPQPTNDAPYDAILPVKALVCEVNPPVASYAEGDPRGALALAARRLDLSHADASDPRLLNEMIWVSVKGPGSSPPPSRRRFGGHAAPGRDLDD